VWSITSTTLTIFSHTTLAILFLVIIRERWVKRLASGLDSGVASGGQERQFLVFSLRSSVAERDYRITEHGHMILVEEFVI
jgi:hypothetical protein